MFACCCSDKRESNELTRSAADGIATDEYGHPLDGGEDGYLYNEDGQYEEGDWDEEGWDEEGWDWDEEQEYGYELPAHESLLAGAIALPEEEVGEGDEGAGPGVGSYQDW